MKVLVDLQAFQALGSSQRRVDHYGASLARAMIRHSGKHDIHVVLNQSSEDALEELQNKFPDLVRSVNFRVSQLPFSGTPRRWCRRATEVVREHRCLELKPDVVLCSLLTGSTNAGIISTLRPTSIPTAITLHNLFPWFNREMHLSAPSDFDPSVQALERLRETDLVLTVSGYCRSQLVDALDLQPERVVVIPPAADVRFRRLAAPAEQERALRLRFRLNRDFVMSIGGTAYRKNVEALIEAYALLPFELRTGHQLAVLGRINGEERGRLQRLARSRGLADGELIVTGYVDDEDLTSLYNICKVFIFPSLYEDFALPPLEAMSCGAPVIGSNRSSVPEVIGLPKALFDPVSARRISEKLYEVITNAQFRAELKVHALKQARRFTWRESARQAFKAMEVLDSSRHDTRRAPSASRLPKTRPLLAFVSPLPPERSGIADYSAELLPELTRHYEIDLITDLAQIADPYLQENFCHRSVAEFERTARRYDRVLYHIGNSPFHRQIPSLLECHPGTVVLHDFFLSHLFYYLEGIDGNKALQRSLYQSHGYPGLLTWARKGAEAAVWTYPCNLSVLSRAQGVIVHSEHVRQLAREWFGIPTENWVVIPQLRRVPKIISREDARRSLGVSPETFLVCSFGFLAPTKLNELLFDSWVASRLANSKDCQLVFVGGDGDGRPYQIGGALSDRIRVTGYLSSEEYQSYLSAADVGIQLRNTLFRGETPRSVFDCMAHGLATVVTAHPALTDLPADSVLTLEGFGAGELVAALERLYSNPKYRTELGRRAHQYVKDKLDPALSARRYADALEKFAEDHPVAVTSRLIAEIADLPASPPPSDDDLGRLATCLAENSGRCGFPQLFVDVTVLSSLGDSGTGIQRVTRAILSELLENPPAGYRVEPVFRKFRQTYRYARAFASKSLGLETPDLDDAPVAVNPGDIFLGLDWDPGIDSPARAWLLYNRLRGMRTVFAIYDLLPLQRSDWFKPEMGHVFRAWFSQICQVADGFACISRTVADELSNWLDTHQSNIAGSLEIDYFHLGSDIEASSPSRGLTLEDQTVLDVLKGREVLIMIGSVEPRKGHHQALSAMERLWAKGEDLSLVILGKQGWMVESMAQRLRSHSELGRRLFWLDQASDETLVRLYSIASGMLMASEGEGFGLPLVEAACYGVPIIARDIPIFREIAGEHAFYFSGLEPAELADALLSWLGFFRLGEHPKPDKLRRLTWKESTNELLQVVLQGRTYKRWRSARTMFLDESAPQGIGGLSAEMERDSLTDSELATRYAPADEALPAAGRNVT